ncbi:HNH endonuclease domain-containing protein [Kiritimatiellota bacterium B12222]|nr:HNH endonuclease domain-containing protein [Kiritimatiellota bacterium B12222]
MKTLGLDLGTNSVGWAVVDSANGGSLVAKGVQVFNKGVGDGKTGEYSLASERTGYRAARRIKQRRKWRKQATLAILVKHNLCPGLTLEAIDAWRYEKAYPTDESFIAWQRIWERDERGEPATPYYYRWLMATRPQDLSDDRNRYRLGRALYHLAQRRGYKSNRLSGDEKEGAVISAIKEKKEARGNRTLGQYFYEECQGKKAMRGEGQYTGRGDYIEEFDKICEVQRLPEEMVNELRHAIFFQRPLKSQKGTVGPCLLEPKKRRIPVSHPVYERFCAVQFVNNIRLRPQGKSEYRPLNSEERTIVLAWMASRKKVEKFEALARQITPKRSKRVFSEKPHELDISLWGLNFRKDAGVPASPTTEKMIRLFGKDWPDVLQTRYVKAKGKTKDQVVVDVWHAMYNFDDHQKLEQFAVSQLGLETDEDVAVFCDPLKQGYGTLSLQAILKILPWLEQGLIYSHAVFLANLSTIFNKNGLEWEDVKSEVVGKIGGILETHRTDRAVERAINSLIKYFRAEDVQDLSMYLASGLSRRETESRIRNSLRAALGGKVWSEMKEDLQEELAGQVMNSCKVRYIPKPSDINYIKVRSIQERVEDMLHDDYGLSRDAIKKYIYHPSATEAYPKTDELLGSPRIASIRNPVFMRTMHRMRAIVNELLMKGIIDSETIVQVEMARDLNNANDRAAIYRYQREREKLREGYGKKIEEAGFLLNEINLLKYQLWVEQEERCLYTDTQISLTDFLGENPVYDIEHTIPQSRRFDDAQTNLTLCERGFNREVKRNRIPHELENHEAILDRARKLWEPKINSLEDICARDALSARVATDKASKDAARQRLLFHRMELRYWKDKLRNFEVTEVPEGFLNSQLVDTRIISKYAVLFLKSYFERVYSMKASALSKMKEIWGLTNKSRDQHVHHCIDAVIAASIRPAFYRDLAQYFHEFERYEFNNGKRPKSPEPWDGFAQYLNEKISEDVIIVHHHKDLLLKQSFQKLRKNGKVISNADGKAVYIGGDTVRGSLHKETNYGKIQHPIEAGAKQSGEVVCVVRKKLDKTFKDFDLIVDPVIRKCVMEQKEKLQTGDEIWFDESRNVPIRKVRVYDRVKPDSMIELKAHRDQSRKEHKQSMYAANDGNYLTALYRGQVKGKPKSDWLKLSNMEAVMAWKNNTWETVLPEVDGKGLRKAAVLKTGTQVLFCQRENEDIKKLSQQNLVQRLYKVTVMEGGQIQFRKNMTAKPAGDLGKGVSKIDWNEEVLPEKLRMATNKLCVKVEGQHFKISDTGEVTWLE